MASAVNAVSVAAPSAADISRNFSEAKSLRSSDFGGGRAKNGCSRARITPSDVHVALGGGAAFAIERLAHGAEMWSSSSALPGPVSQAISVSVPSI